MKKIFFTLLLAVAMAFSFTSCKTQENVSFGVVYNVQLTGDGDGQVAVTFPNGSFDMNGDADLAFKYSNDTTSLLKASKALTAEQIEEDGTKDEKQALTNVNGWLDQNFGATAASGTYDVRVQGYVKETLTGVIIAVDRRFTNRTDSVQ